MENKTGYQYGNKALNILDVSGSALLEYLQNQKRIGLELQAPQGEIELLDHIIKKVNEMMDKYYKAIEERPGAMYNYKSLLKKFEIILYNSK